MDLDDLIQTLEQDDVKKNDNKIDKKDKKKYFKRGKTTISSNNNQKFE